ncbi:Co2+/Mg2+ efflux protein ApaG [Eilatimonas milleporae]|uniref:Protein ApaG n=1 Tax=Eilatimonas milleporae TaxID=911205 RepID=A0A3M0C0L2_9PROT|nr:Co2+/Mg2+ efflux protein ApaG [Eilatimonas milleporae]RMB01870.1 ApaG protein [Eilatimonas milleporae]
MEDLIDGVMTFEDQTDGVRVQVQSYYLSDQSEPDEGRYVWAYRIKISNDGSDTVQLINRHWVITDANGNVQEVRGAGVVGEQPVLEPGDHFVYTSGTPLDTPTGFMTGSYEMQRPSGTTLTVAIPTFSLDSPFFDNGLN